MENENDIAPINEDLNVPNYEVEQIKQKIYTIRGKQVILDSDIAREYEVDTKRLNEAVKRNIKRFPEKYCFQLSSYEYNSLRSQIATLKNYGRGEHRKYLPYVFTEQGVAMLSAVLHSDKAIKVSIRIIDAFIEMRKIINDNQLLFNKINNIELNQHEYQVTTNKKIIEHDRKIDIIFNEFEKYNKEQFKQQIFFEGKIWDAYNLIIKIIKQAEEKILIIDNYIDDCILEMLTKKKKNVEVIIFTSYHSKISKLDIQKFNREYPSLKVIKTNKFHDRFIAIDNKALYHCGASLKDLGEKCFAITKMEDIRYIDKIEESYKNDLKNKIS